MYGQTNQAKSLVISYLDPASQTNAIVAVADFVTGQPCPAEFSNVLSNTNLFTYEQQKQIEEIFYKYKDITTNSGPVGTILIGYDQTNYLVRTEGQTISIPRCLSRFRYTNSDAVETITIGPGGMNSEYRDKSDNGYDIGFIRTGYGTMLRFVEKKGNSANGILVSIEDLFHQGKDWDFRRAQFSDQRVTEYRQYTNGLVLGKFLMWDPRTGKLIVEAEFKEPYDYQKHLIGPGLR